MTWERFNLWGPQRWRSEDSSLLCPCPDNSSLKSRANRHVCRPAELPDDLIIVLNVATEPDKQRWLQICWDLCLHQGVIFCFFRILVLLETMGGGGRGAGANPRYTPGWVASCSWALPKGTSAVLWKHAGTSPAPSTPFSFCEGQNSTDRASASPDCVFLH